MRILSQFVYRISRRVFSRKGRTEIYITCSSRQQRQCCCQTGHNTNISNRKAQLCLSLMCLAPVYRSATLKNQDRRLAWKLCIYVAANSQPSGSLESVPLSHSIFWNAQGILIATECEFLILTAPKKITPFEYFFQASTVTAVVNTWYVLNDMARRSPKNKRKHTFHVRVFFQPSRRRYTTTVIAVLLLLPLLLMLLLLLCSCCCVLLLLRVDDSDKRVCALIRVLFRSRNYSSCLPWISL